MMRFVNSLPRSTLDISIAPLWIVDPEARSVDAYVLREGAYVLAGHPGADAPPRAAPFSDLEILTRALRA